MKKVEVKKHKAARQPPRSGRFQGIGKAFSQQR
jgi:hypothetical protein